jgi:XTP/dITP diphosphohydrolase
VGENLIKIIIATKNEGKIREIKEIVKLDNVEFLTFQNLKDWPEVEEKGSTFRENAVLKAKALMNLTKLPALADDSGLEVDVLSGEPGILSARYAGSHCSTSDNNAKLLKKLESFPFEKRTARFRCVAAFAGTDGTLLVSEGICSGHIALEHKGSGGFGYDPLFVPDGYNKTIAELSAEEKNQISHRGKAFRDLKEKLKKVLETN